MNSAGCVKTVVEQLYITMHFACSFYLWCFLNIVDYIALMLDE